MDKIKKRLVTLSSSKTISKSKLHRIEMLLREISRNRARVQDILQRMDMVLTDDVNEDVLRMLKLLTREQLLSEVQYLKLTEMEKDFDIDKLISVIKDTKIGRGLDFLPRKTNDLMDQLKVWLSDFAEEGTGVIRDKTLAVLAELLQRKAISQKEYNNIKTENNVE